MNYKTEEIIRMMKTFHNVENTLSDFLFKSSFAMKHKKGSAEKVLRAIEEYNKIPREIRLELEKDKNININNIKELEILCKKELERDISKD